MNKAVCALGACVREDNKQLSTCTVNAQSNLKCAVKGWQEALRGRSLLF